MILKTIKKSVFLFKSRFDRFLISCLWLILITLRFLPIPVPSPKPILSHVNSWMPDRPMPLAKTNRTNVQWAVGRQPSLYKVSFLTALCRPDFRDIRSSHPAAALADTTENDYCTGWLLGGRGGAVVVLCIGCIRAMWPCGWAHTGADTSWSICTCCNTANCLQY